MNFEPIASIFRGMASANRGLGFQEFCLFDRVHLPIIGKRAAVVEEDLLSVRESARARSARIRSNQRRAAIRPAVVCRAKRNQQCNRLREILQLARTML